MNAKVFINYRREDTAPYAGRLYDRLTAHFGENQVFIDIDQIDPGEDFVEAINRKVGTCDTAIVAIGPRWLGATDASGRRRLDDEEDFVRMEIVAALQRNIRVIPVLVGGAKMPRKQDLPEALAPLSRRNAIELSETRFHADVNRLIEAIEKSFAVVEKKTELSAKPAAPPAEPERSQQDSVAPAKHPTTPVKSNHPTPPDPPPAPSTSSIAALKGPAVSRRKRLIILSAVGATVILLLTIVWSFTRPHPLVGPSEPSKPAEPKLTDQRDAAAQFNLGVRYEDGQGVPQDLVKAAELYQKAANQGHAGAQFNLGLLYAHGQGVPKDLVKAAEFYQKAANQGHAGAQNNLGALYEHGEGVTKDFDKAVELYQKAADQGNTVAKNHLADAQNHLGRLYENGQGVPKDLVKAAELYQKAANQGDQDAIANLKSLSKSVEPKLESQKSIETLAETPSSQSEFTGGYDPEIAFVNMQQIFKEYTKTKTAETKISDAKNAVKKEYDDRVSAYKTALDEINNLNKQLESRALRAAEKAQVAKERDDKIANIKNMEREIKEFRETRERQLQEQVMRVREGIVKEITDKVRELGGDVANIIFDKSGMSINGVPVLMYSPDRGDMSGKVISALNNGSRSAFTTTRSLKIAAIDMQRAFKNYNKTKHAESEINDAKNAAKKEYDDRAEAYKKALDEINNLNRQLESRALSADEKTQMAKERDDKIANIKNMEREISDFRQTRERQLQEKTMRMREGIVKEITDVVMNAVKTNNIGVVLDISGMSINGVPVVIYRHGFPDFTDEAVAKLNGTSFSGTMLASSDPSRTQRFGVVDMQRAFQAWPETKAAEAKINDEKAAAKNDYASQSQEEREKRNKQIEDDLRKLREPIVAKIEATVNTCAERAGFNLVFDSSGNSINGVPVVVFARDLPDLTDAVLKEHDRSP
jgi:TPR repeat protein